MEQTNTTPQDNLSRADRIRLRNEGLERRRIARRIRGEQRMARIATRNKVAMEFQNLVRRAVAEGKPIPMKVGGCGGCHKAKRKLEELKKQAEAKNENVQPQKLA